MCKGLPRSEVDEDSIDLSFALKSIAGKSVSPKLDAQLKCTSKLVSQKKVFKYPLKIKNYKELVGDHFVPKILIVVWVPPNPQEWLNQTPKKLSLSYCGYWVSLKDLSESENTSTVTVEIPKDQVFSVAALRGLLGGHSE